MSNATNFLAWLIEDINDVSAEVGSPRDKQLQEFAEAGFLRLYQTAHRTNFYEITNKGATSYAA